MTREVFGPAPHSGDDPLSAAHVTPLVVYLASPAAEAITGRVLSVYGDRIDVMSAPAVEASLRTPTRWEHEELSELLGGYFGSSSSVTGPEATRMPS